MVGRKTFQMANADRALDAGPLVAAAVFAGPRANAAQHARQNVVLLVHQMGFRRPAVGNMANVLGHVRSGRTSRAAGNVTGDGFEVPRRCATPRDHRQFQRIDGFVVADCQRFDGAAVGLDAQPRDILGQAFFGTADLHKGVENRRHHADAIVLLELAHGFAKPLLRAANGDQVAFGRALLLADAQPAQADVGNAVRRARIGAARDVHQDPVANGHIFRVVNQVAQQVEHRVRRRDGQRAVRGTDATHDVAQPEEVFGLQAQGLDFGPQLRQALGRNAVQLEILPVGAVDMLVAKDLGQLGNLGQMSGLQLALGDLDLLDGQSVAAPRVGFAEGRSPAVPARYSIGRHSKPLRSTPSRSRYLVDQFAATLDSQPVDDKFQPGVHANLAIAMVAEQQADRPAYLDNLFRRHERVERLGDKRLPAHAPADHDAKTLVFATVGPLADHGYDADAVDVWLPAVTLAARVVDLELARQVVQFAAAGHAFGRAWA